MRRWLAFTAIGSIAGAIVGAIIALTPGSGAAIHVADACAFRQTPNTYEGRADRGLYQTAMELAGHNLLFPGDTFFSQRTIGVGTRSNRTASQNDVYVPPTLLKAINWVESVHTQAGQGVPFGGVGPALVSFDCGHGIAQITSGMTAPIGEGGQPSNQQALVATHFGYNIGRGMAMMVDKWNAAPSSRPIAGIDTNSNPRIVENWYYAVWSYNGFTGPGANRSNHPMDPIYGTWPRTPYSCGPANDGLSHNRSRHPYQELVFGCMANPPVVQGRPLWQPLRATLPDLNNPYWRTPLRLENFRFPYSQMDIPTPKPQTLDPAGQPTNLHKLAVLGLPDLRVSQPIVLVNARPGATATPVDIRLSNAGFGIAPYRVSTDKSWLSVSQQAGVAISSDMFCSSNCERSPTLRISVDPQRITGSEAGVVRIHSLGPGGRPVDVAVFVRVNVAVGVPGTTRN
jgi:hypothetical protein